MEMKDEALLRQHKSGILFHSTDVNPSLVECLKTIRVNAFKCNTNHLTSPPTFCPSLMPLPQLENAISQLSRLLSIFKKEKLVCEACIHICHNNHEQRTFVVFGEGSATSKLGNFRRACGYLARNIKCFIVGETKCSCKELTQCRLLKSDLDSFSIIDWFKSGLMGSFVFCWFALFALDPMLSIIKDPFSIMNNLVLIPLTSFNFYIFYLILRA